MHRQVRYNTRSDILFDGAYSFLTGDFGKIVLCGTAMSYTLPAPSVAAGRSITFVFLAGCIGTTLSLASGTWEDGTTAAVAPYPGMTLTVTGFSDGTYRRVWGTTGALGLGNVQQRGAGVIGAATVGDLPNIYVAPYKGYVLRADITAGTAPTGANLIGNVKKNGTTIFTVAGNKPTITAGQQSGSTTAVNVVTFNAGDTFTFGIDQIGSTVAGSDIAILLTFLFA